MNVFQLHDLLFTPKIESSMVMQSNDAWSRLGHVFWDQDKCRDTDVRSCIEVDLFADILATVHLFNRFRARIARRGSIMKQLEKLPASHLLPTRKRLVLRTQVRELKITRGLALDERKERTHV